MMVDKTTAPTRKILSEVYSRVSGFYRPVQQYNKGKKEEFRERKYLNVEKAIAQPNSQS